VLEFLGHVNRFPAPDGSEAGFARPHEIAVQTDPDDNALAARLVHSASVGPIARLEFALLAGSRTINVELPRERFRALKLAPGAVAYLRATQLRQFCAA